MGTAAQIIDAVKHRLPDRDNLYPAINTVIKLINKRLFNNKSSLVRGELSVSVTSGSSSTTLPADFWGFIDRENPYISGKTWKLQPLPNQEYKLEHQTNSQTKYYELIGFNLGLIPPTSSAITIKGAYWTAPTAITKPTDTMPYGGMFDDVIQDGVVAYYTEGSMAVKGLIETAVDEVSPYRDKPAPKRVVDSLGLNFRTRSGWDGWR